MAKRKNRKIDIKQYNNKSRKGLYIYIKDKGKRAGIYKYKEEVPIEEYVRTYESGGLKSKKKGVTTQRKRGETQKAFLKKVTRRPSISTSFEKGTATATLKDINMNMNSYEIKETNKRMLKKLIKHKGILDVMTTDTNMQKISKYMQYLITIRGTKGEIIGRIKYAKGDKTLQQVGMDMKRITHGATIKDNSNTIMQLVHDIGYTFDYVKDGIVNKVNITQKMIKRR